MKKVLEKLFGGAAANMADSIGDLVDRFVRTKEEKDAFNKEMTQIFIDAEQEFQKNVTERWRVDLTDGNWLTKSVRPLVLIFLIFCTVLLVFIDSGFINFDVDDQWKDLLQILLVTVVAAYFGGRSYEKGQSIKKK